MIAPGTPEHTRIISASKVAAILGVSPWISQRALWHIMRGDVPADTVGGDRAHLDLGHDLEPAIAAMWRRRHPHWRLSRGERQYTNPDLPFPHIATPDRLASRGVWRRLVELKSARDDEHWGDEGTDEIPAPYLVQTMFQMLVSRIPECDVMVLFAWFEPRVYHLAFDPELAEAIVDRCDAFYRSLSGDEPPDLDDTAATLAVLRKLHPDIDPEATAHVDPAVGVEFLDAGTDLERAKARENLSRARILDAAGTARHIEAAGVRIGRRQPSKSGVVLHRLKVDRADILPNPAWKGTS